MMQSNYSVKEFCENTKVARELAVVGQYENASVYFEGAISFMQPYINLCADQSKKQKYQQVLQRVKIEYEILKEARDMLRTIGLHFDSPLSTHRSDYEPSSPNDIWSVGNDDPTIWPPNLADKDKWPTPTTVDHW